MLVVSAILLNCNAPAGPQAQEGETRLVIGIHGSPTSLARGNVHEVPGIEALLLSVNRIDLRGPGGWTRLTQEEGLVVDILAASRHDPIILSNVSVEPGFYTELRLVLNEENLIRVNGVYHPLRIPSGTSSGLKLKGDFEIPRGRLFNLNVELDTARSVSWNQGQGYRLHPVLNISDAPHILGIFRGNLTLHGGIGGGETLVQLFYDGTARIRSARFPNYTIWANYHYNSVTRVLRLDDINLDAPGMGRFRLRRVMRELPDQFLLPIRQWSLDNIIAIDTIGVTANLYRVDEFSFSRGVSFTEFTLNIDHPGSPRVGSYVVTEIRFIDTGHTKTLLNIFGGGRITQQVLVPNDFIQGSSTRLHISTFLFENPDDLNIKMVDFACVPKFLLASSHVTESGEKPWQPQTTFTLIRDERQEFTVSFRRGMNIRVDHGNFTNNNPVVSWDPFPGVNNGYFMLAIVRNRDFDPTM
ncbi:MAG: DUF4382 domain-containing protein [Treponema sp.]|nr:DUF4382 domain-containing protein [Treponema sp.]